MAMILLASLSRRSAPHGGESDPEHHFRATARNCIWDLDTGGQMTGEQAIDALPAGIVALVHRFSRQLVAVKCLTALPSELRAHAAFMVELADGTRVKARQVETAEQANRIVAIRSVLPDRHFPKILAHCDTALIEEWIDGSPIASRPTDHPTAIQSGQLLGLIHKSPIPPVLTSPDVSMPGRRLTRLDRQTNELVDRGKITSAEKDRILELSRRHRPDHCESGIIHRDFCAENLIEGRRGALYAVDNETMRYDALDFDLARTWYRWPMEPDYWSSFLDGYGSLRSTVNFKRHAPFWCLSALVDTFLFRVRAETAEQDLPYKRLLTLLHDSTGA